MYTETTRVSQSSPHAPTAIETGTWGRHITVCEPNFWESVTEGLLEICSWTSSLHRCLALWFLPWVAGIDPYIVHWLLVNYMLLINQCTASILICFKLHEPSSFSLQHSSFPAEPFPASQPTACTRAMADPIPGTRSAFLSPNFPRPIGPFLLHTKVPLASNPHSSIPAFPLDHSAYGLTRRGLHVTLSSLAWIRMLNCPVLTLAS